MMIDNDGCLVLELDWMSRQSIFPQICCCCFFSQNRFLHAIDLKQLFLLVERGAIVYLQMAFHRE
jgi:hypothetical protein